MIGGNHDSPARLAAPAPLLAALGVTVIASMPRDPADAIIELDGAIIAAVPFLRPFDLPAVEDPAEAVRTIYMRALEAARARRAGRPIVLTGHLFIAGASPSVLSERRIVSGGVEAIDGGLFPDDVAYVALGHLHRAQRVGREHVRYAGSPIPLAMVEAEYRHQVMLVELDGAAPVELRPLYIPRTMELIRIPRHGALPLDQALVAIAALPPLTDELDTRPLLEVAIALPEPQPRLRDKIEAAVADRAVRLVKIHAALTGDRAALADVATGRGLAELDPREVLQRRWARDHDAPVPAEVARALDELLEQARSAP